MHCYGKEFLERHTALDISLSYFKLLFRHSIRNHFTLHRPKLLLLLEVEWHIVAACIIEMQLCENPFHHSPIPPRLSHVLHTQWAG
jgi:hypothetical protein